MYERTIERLGGLKVLENFQTSLPKRLVLYVHGILLCLFMSGKAHSLVTIVVAPYGDRVVLERAGNDVKAAERRMRAKMLASGRRRPEFG